MLRIRIFGIERPSYSIERLLLSREMRRLVARYHQRFGVNLGRKSNLFVLNSRLRTRVTRRYRDPVLTWLSPGGTIFVNAK